MCEKEESAFVVRAGTYRSIEQGFGFRMAIAVLVKPAEEGSVVGVVGIFNEGGFQNRDGPIETIGKAKGDAQLRSHAGEARVETAGLLEFAYGEGIVTLRHGIGAS